MELHPRPHPTDRVIPSQALNLTQRQAAVLNVIANSSHVTTAVIESATTFDTDVIVEVVQFLLLQVLIEQDESRFQLAPHLREKQG